jgi:hypothetical protein
MNKNKQKTKKRKRKRKKKKRNTTIRTMEEKKPHKLLKLAFSGKD